MQSKAISKFCECHFVKIIVYAKQSTVLNAITNGLDYFTHSTTKCSPMVAVCTLADTICNVHSPLYVVCGYCSACGMPADSQHQKMIRIPIFQLSFDSLRMFLPSNKSHTISTTTNAMCTHTHSSPTSEPKMKDDGVVWFTMS